MRYLEVFQTDYDCLKTPVGLLVQAVRMKYRRLIPTTKPCLPKSFSLVTTGRYIILTGCLSLFRS